MSDGPHRSLPLRPGWRRVAERGDNSAYASEDVSEALIPALEQDCRADLSSAFLEALRDLYRDQESSLFRNDMTSQLEALQGIAGAGFDTTVLDYAIRRSANGETDFDAAQKAVADALTDRAARGARQIEEHYCRKSTAPRAVKVRARIEQGIANARPGIEGLSQRLLTMDPGPAARVVKRRELDDGVKL
jgi:hypothetical protein